MKHKPILDNGTYNIIRTQGRNKSIFLRNLDGVTTRRELSHWKKMARNAGGNVYFNAEPVPTEVRTSVHSVGNGAVAA